MRYGAMAIVIAIALVVVGCAARNEPAAMHTEEQPYHEEGRIQFQSATTKHLLQIVRVDPQRQAGTGLLDLIVTIRNKTKKDLWVDTRVTFLDEDGHVLEQTNWMPVHLDPRTVSEHRWTSLSEGAHDYQIVFKKPAESTRDLP